MLQTIAWPAAPYASPNGSSACSRKARLPIETATADRDAICSASAATSMSRASGGTTLLTSPKRSA